MKNNQTRPFRLKDKRFTPFVDTGSENQQWFYPETEIKEFLRLLKEEIKKLADEVLQEHDLSLEEWKEELEEWKEELPLIKKIDKLSGFSEGGEEDEK